MRAFSRDRAGTGQGTAQGGARHGTGRRRLLAAPLILAGLPAGQAGAEGASPARVGQFVETGPKALPEFGFTDAEGNPRKVADFAGVGLVINLWATWCPPCVAEMPALDRAHAVLAPEGITILALSSDRGGKAQVAPFYERTGVKSLGIWLDPRAAAQRALGVRGLPTTIIVDRTGQERARLEGAVEWDAPPILAAVRRLVRPVSAPVRTDQERT